MGSLKAAARLVPTKGGCTRCQAWVDRISSFEPRRAQERTVRQARAHPSGIAKMRDTHSTISIFVAGMQIAKWGNSLAVRLPAAGVEALDLKPGENIDSHARGGRS